MFLAVITILAVTAGLTVNGQIPGVIVGSCGLVGTRTTKCWTDSAIPEPMINGVSVNDVVGLRGSAFGTNKTLACNTANKAMYLAQTKCVLSAYRQCGDNDYDTLVMEEAAYESAFNYLCSNLAAIDAAEKCFFIDSVNDCKRNRMAREKVTDNALPDISEPFKDIRKYHCKRMHIEEECAAHDTDVATCFGTSNNRAIYEEFYKLKKPSACGATSIILASGLMVISLVASFVKF